MRQRVKDNRYKEGVDRGRMATQSLPLPVKKDYKPATPKPPAGGVTVIVKGGGEETKVVAFEDLPKQIQRHIAAKIGMMGKKIK